MISVLMRRNILRWQMTKIPSKRKKKYIVYYEPDPMPDSFVVRAFSEKEARKIALEEHDLDEYQIDAIRQIPPKKGGKT